MWKLPCSWLSRCDVEMWCVLWEDLAWTQTQSFQSPTWVLFRNLKSRPKIETEVQGPRIAKTWKWWMESVVLAEARHPCSGRKDRHLDAGRDWEGTVLRAGLPSRQVSECWAGSESPETHGSVAYQDPKTSQWAKRYFQPLELGQLVSSLRYWWHTRNSVSLVVDMRKAFCKH